MYFLYEFKKLVKEARENKLVTKTVDEVVEKR